MGESEQVTFGAAAARALLAASRRDVCGRPDGTCEGRVWAPRGENEWSAYDLDHLNLNAPFRLANPDAELTEEQAEAVCKAQEGLVADGGGDLYKRHGGKWQWWSGRDWLFFPVSPPGNVARWEPEGRTFRLVPDPAKADDIREIAARAAAESRSVAEQPESETLTDGQMLDRCLTGECVRDEGDGSAWCCGHTGLSWLRHDGESWKDIDHPPWGEGRRWVPCDDPATRPVVEPETQPEPEVPCTHAQSEAYEARIRELEGELGKARKIHEAETARAESWTRYTAEAKRLSRQWFASFKSMERENAKLRAELEKAHARGDKWRNRCTELEGEAETQRHYASEGLRLVAEWRTRCEKLRAELETQRLWIDGAKRLLQAQDNPEPGPLPRTTRLLSEAVLHAEAGGVVEFGNEAIRLRDGEWELRALVDDVDEWETGEWHIDVGVTYTLHPADYLDDAPEKVEPRPWHEALAWAVDNPGRVFVDTDGDRFWAPEDGVCAEAAWVSRRDGYDNVEARSRYLPRWMCLPESGTWDRSE